LQSKADWAGKYKHCATLGNS